MNGKDMWNFFYDEAFHDRKIDVTKENIINIYSENASDVYVGAFIGCKEENLTLLYKEFEQFENKFKKEFGLKEDQELKGTIIKKGNFQYGINSFNKKALEFYEDYFSLLDSSNLIFNINMLSKTALFILKAFKNVNNNGCYYQKNVFLYSLIKFLYNHRYMELLLNLFDENKLESSNEILDRLTSFIDEVIEKIKDSRKKALELNALREMRYILKRISVDNIANAEYLWDYNDIFEGFNLLLDQRVIKHNQINLVIDREPKTYKAAMDMGKYNSVKEAESEDVAGVRIADILSNFIGRMILALDEDLKEEEIKDIGDLNNIDYISKKILSPQWFKLNEQKFNIYTKLHSIFINMIKEYNWTTYGSLFFDYSTLFFCLIQYIGAYESYNSFIEVNEEVHSEKFNTYCCEVLQLRFRQLY